ncbi:MAG: PorV/PorQ family protein [Bacteroidales bacterium]|nr:PorV/PorQ family protein [Bacteroidales bacterium]
MKHSKSLTVIILTVAALMASPTLYAQEAFTFLRLDRSPVTTAMAGAGFSITEENNAYAAFGNPAASAFMGNRASASVNYRRWAPAILDEHHITAAFAVKPIEKLAVQAGFAKGIQPVLDEENPFHANDNNFAIGLSYAITDNISAGINGHYAFQELVKGYKLQGFALDVIGQYHGENFNVAGGVVSIGPKVKSEQSGAYPLPASAQIAGDYTYKGGIASITMAADGDYYFSGHWGVSGGASVLIKDMVFVRAGGRFASSGTALPTHLAAGAGFKYKFITIEASYITANSIIGNSFMGGVNINF